MNITVEELVQAANDARGKLEQCRKQTEEARALVKTLLGELNLSYGTDRNGFICVFKTNQDGRATIDISVFPGRCTIYLGGYFLCEHPDAEVALRTLAEWLGMNGYADNMPTVGAEVKRSGYLFASDLANAATELGLGADHGR